MNLTIAKEQIINGLQAVQNVVSTRTTLPILSNVLMRAEGEKLEFTATDLDVTIACSVEAKVKKPGASTVPVKKLFGIVRELANSEIDLEVDDKNVCSIRSGASFYKINGLSADEFPPLQKWKLGAFRKVIRHMAEAHEKVFREYCGRVLGEVSSPRMVIDPARASLEALAFALQVWKDPDARSLTRAQRAEYASGLGWFSNLCPEADPDKAIALARSLGRLTGIAALYRKHKDEADPSRQRRLAQARTTRSGQLTGDSESTPSPEA